MVFAARTPAIGVLLLRYPSSARSSLATVVLDVVAARHAELRGSFTVIGPAGVAYHPAAGPQLMRQQCPLEITICTSTS